MSIVWSTIEVLVVATAVWLGMQPRMGRGGMTALWKRVLRGAAYGTATFVAVEALLAVPKAVSIPVVAAVVFFWLLRAANRERFCRRVAGAAGATAEWSAQEAERAARAAEEASDAGAVAATLVPDATGLDGNTSIAKAWLLLHQ